MWVVPIMIMAIWGGFLLGAIIAMKITLDKIVRDVKKLEKYLPQVEKKNKWAGN